MFYGQQVSIIHIHLFQLLLNIQVSILQEKKRKFRTNFSFSTKFSKVGCICYTLQIYHAVVIIYLLLFSLYHPSYPCYYEHCRKRKTLPVFSLFEYRIKVKLPIFRVLHVSLRSFQRG